MAELVFKKRTSNGQSQFCIKISKDYKEKLDLLRDSDVKLGESLRPKLYAWVDEAVRELKSQK